MKKDEPLTLEEKVNAMMIALSRIEARQIAFRRVVLPRRAVQADVSQEEENTPK
jgi:hypothetical protein